MIKKKLYGSTVRYGKDIIYLTEKIDGSNLGLFKLNGKILVAQRNNIFIYPDEKADITYGKLAKWLDAHGEKLLNDLHEGSGLFGEWIGEKKGDYEFPQDFMIFAKATIDENLNISNLNYDVNLFIYPFIEKVVPTYMGIVPVVAELDHYPLIDELDGLYEHYGNIVKRKVEGFVINYNNSIRKYVRFKSNKLIPHEAEPYKNRKG